MSHRLPEVDLEQKRREKMSKDRSRRESISRPERERNALSPQRAERLKQRPIVTPVPSIPPFMRNKSTPVGTPRSPIMSPSPRSPGNLPTRRRGSKTESSTPVAIATRKALPDLDKVRSDHEKKMQRAMVQGKRDDTSMRERERAERQAAERAHAERERAERERARRERERADRERADSEAARREAAESERRRRAADVEWEAKQRLRRQTRQAEGFELIRGALCGMEQNARRRWFRRVSSSWRVFSANLQHFTLVLGCRPGGAGSG